MSKEPAVLSIEITAVAQLQIDLTSIAQSIQTHDPRPIVRLMRMFPIFRKRLSSRDLAPFVNTYASEFAAAFPTEETVEPSLSATSVIKTYILLLGTLTFFPSNLNTASTLIAAAMQIVKSDAFHSLPESDGLGARVLHWYAVVHERVMLTNATAGQDLYPVYLALFRHSALRRRFAEQGVLLNAMLRMLVTPQAGITRLDLAIDLLNTAAADPADVAKIFGSRNGDWARFLLYAGKVAALQVDYTKALGLLSQAGKKAPVCEESQTFRAEIGRWVVMVGLLMGDIPERGVFPKIPSGTSSAVVTAKKMHKYLLLTTAVRNGDVAAFEQVKQKYGRAFQQEDTYTLVTRLHENVLKAGLRRITLSYSRIGLDQVARKLGLESVEEARGVAAKAVVEGVIEGRIEGDVLVGEWLGELYETTKPQDQLLKRRVGYLMSLQEDMVKAMEFEEKKANMDTIDDVRRREEEEEFWEAGEFDEF
jgi:26S proteasome regulatory subunit N3